MYSNALFQSLRENEFVMLIRYFNIYANTCTILLFLFVHSCFITLLSIFTDLRYAFDFAVEREEK